MRKCLQTVGSESGSEHRRQLRTWFSAEALRLPPVTFLKQQIICLYLPLVLYKG